MNANSSNDMEWPLMLNGHVYKADVSLVTHSAIRFVWPKTDKEAIKLLQATRVSGESALVE